MAEGVSFPPLVVFHEGEAYWLAEGFHRHHAAQEAGLAEMPCEVRPGDLREAILHSVGSNATHGLRRSNADKRRAALILLEDSEWSTWSDREIARRCAVDNSFVSRLRSSLLQNNSEPTPLTCNIASEPEPRTYRDRYGNVTQMRTASIGRKPVEAPVASPFHLT